jgi:AraC-like DNA-binding protein
LFSEFINLFCLHFSGSKLYVYCRHIVFFRFNADCFFHCAVLEKSTLTKSKSLSCLRFSIARLLGFFYSPLYSGLSAKSDFLLSFYFPIDLTLSLCIGPALYFYIRMLFDGNQFQWKKQLGYHALPLLPTVLFLLYFVSIPPDERIAMLLNESFASHRIVVGITVLYCIQSAVYFSSCLIKVKQLRVSNYQLIIDKEQTNIRWLIYLSVLGIATTYIYILVWIFSNSMQINILAQQCIFILLIVYLFIQSLSSTGLSMQSAVAVIIEKQPELSILETPPPPLEHKINNPRRKRMVYIRMVSRRKQRVVHPPKINISEQQAHIILLKLNEILEREQLYLSKKCSLSQLTQCSDIAVHHISTAINSYSAYNFSDFVNKYRVDHVCRLLQTEQLQRLTLVAIGLECGFGSRANFFKTFKRFTGKTPTEYLILQQSILKSVDSQE